MPHINSSISLLVVQHSPQYSKMDHTPLVLNYFYYTMFSKLILRIVILPYVYYI